MPPDELNPRIKPPPSTTGGRILVVEDDPSLRELLATEVAEAGHHTTAVDSAEAARAELSRELPDLVITDIRLPGADGMQLLGSVQKLDHPPAVIVITAFGSVPQAVAAMRQGAVDFLTKPLDLDHLHLAINRALHLRNLEQEVDRLHGLLDNAQLPGLVGNSRPMQRLREHMQLIAGSDAPVLISGESGAGKELVARGLARLSP
ncbi:MAG: sigma-54-dependent Fis family transcriptional regulator, partial [Planctomycetota bacterium]